MTSTLFLRVKVISGLMCDFSSSSQNKSETYACVIDRYSNIIIILGHGHEFSLRTHHNEAPRHGWGKAKIPFTSQCIRTSSGKKKKKRGKNFKGSFMPHSVIKYEKKFNFGGCLAVCLQDEHRRIFWFFFQMEQSQRGHLWSKEKNEKNPLVLIFEIFFYFKSTVQRHTRQNTIKMVWF